MIFVVLEKYTVYSDKNSASSLILCRKQVMLPVAAQRNNHHRGGAGGLAELIVVSPTASVEADNGDGSIVRTSMVAVPGGIIPAQTSQGRAPVQLPP